MFGALRSCVALKEEFIRQIEMGQVDLAEEKSAGIVVDESVVCERCAAMARRFFSIAA